MLILETGAGLNNSNAYIDVDYFNDYWLTRGVAVGNNELDIASAIVIATQYVDSVFSFRGEIKLTTQALSWPRVEVYDNEGREINPDVIPAKLKQAVAEYAKRQLEAALLPDMPETGAIKSKRDKLGDLETETVYQDGTGGYFGIKRYPMADNLIRSLTIGGGMGALRRG